MSKSIRHHAAALSTLALVASGAAHAELLNTPDAFTSALALRPANQVGTTTWGTSVAIHQFATALSAEAQAADGHSTKAALAAAALSLPNLATANLWTFVTAVRAQQKGDSFGRLETQLAFIQLADAPPAPVPLPGSAWLLVMGVLGTVGARLNASRSRAGATQAPLAAAPA